MSRPQFQKRTHRAREFLLARQREHPQEFGIAESLRMSRPDGLPPWCFLPVGLWHEAVERTRPRQTDNPLLAVTLAALTAWRMTQGIYRVDPTIYNALIDTPVTADIPADVLMRMPEWCVYIETPGIEPALHGAWAFLDSTGPGGPPELWYLLDSGPFALPVPVNQGGGSIRAWLDRLIEQDPSLSGSPEVSQIAVTLERITSILLYICTQSDITGRRGAPGNPTPIRTRRAGWKLFPAAGPAFWDVGVRLGAALRRAYQDEHLAADGPGDRAVRPHVRRAHWHGFRSGPRKQSDGTEIPATDRRFDLRWLPPIPVNLDSVDNLPAVIRPVVSDPRSTN